MEMRGQIVTIDFIISLSLFMILLAIAYSMWLSSSLREADGLEQLKAERAASRVLTSMALSYGEPPNFASNSSLSDPSSASLSSIGCASAPHILDRAKLAATSSYFQSANNASALQKLGFGQFLGNITVAYQNGSAAYAFGSPLVSGDILLASGSRLALLGNETVSVRVLVWKRALP